MLRVHVASCRMSIARVVMVWRRQIKQRCTQVALTALEHRGSNASIDSATEMSGCRLYVDLHKHVDIEMHYHCYLCLLSSLDTVPLLRHLTKKLPMLSVNDCSSVYIDILLGVKFSFYANFLVARSTFIMAIWVRPSEKKKLSMKIFCCRLVTSSRI